MPTKIIQDIDLVTLELLDGSFVSEKLKETFTDVILTGYNNGLNIATLAKITKYSEARVKEIIEDIS